MGDVGKHSGKTRRRVCSLSAANTPIEIDEWLLGYRLFVLTNVAVFVRVSGGDPPTPLTVKT